MHQADHHPPTASVARRKLIRGAFAAPALMTICSGSAFATASHMRCLVNAQTAEVPVDAAWVKDGIDGYARVALLEVPVVGTDPPQSRYFVSGDETIFSEYKTAPSGLPPSGKWMEIDVAGGTYKSIGVVDTLPGPVTPPPRYVILRFDADGFIVGLGADTQGAIMGGTCLLSAAPFIRI